MEHFNIVWILPALCNGGLFHNRVSAFFEDFGAENIDVSDKELYQVKKIERISQRILVEQVYVFRNRAATCNGGVNLEPENKAS